MTNRPDKPIDDPTLVPTTTNARRETDESIEAYFRSLQIELQNKIESILRNNKKSFALDSEWNVYAIGPNETLIPVRESCVWIGIIDTCVNNGDADSLEAVMKKVPWKNLSKEEIRYAIRIFSRDHEKYATYTKELAEGYFETFGATDLYVLENAFQALKQWLAKDENCDGLQPLLTRALEYSKKYAQHELDDGLGYRIYGLIGRMHQFDFFRKRVSDPDNQDDPYVASFLSFVAGIENGDPQCHMYLWFLLLENGQVDEARNEFSIGYMEHRIQGCLPGIIEADAMLGNHESREAHLLLAVDQKMPGAEIALFAFLRERIEAGDTDKIESASAILKKIIAIGYKLKPEDAFFEELEWFRYHMFEKTSSKGKLASLFSLMLYFRSAEATKLFWMELIAITNNSDIVLLQETFRFLISISPFRMEVPEQPKVLQETIMSIGLAMAEKYLSGFDPKTTDPTVFKYIWHFAEHSGDHDLAKRCFQLYLAQLESGDNRKTYEMLIDLHSHELVHTEMRTVQ